MALHTQRNEITKKLTVNNLSNPFSTGGGGVDFEHRVQATFLLALLVKGFSPLLDLPVTSLDFQAKRLDKDIDDIVVTASAESRSAKLLCQIKHGITLGENPTFKEVIAAAWSDFNKVTFDPNADKIVLISGSVTNANSLRFIHDQANGASSARDFLNRIQTSNYSSDINREKLDVIKRNLSLANDNHDVTDEQLWAFCKVFTILIFDLDYESSINDFLIRSLIASNCKDDAMSVWALLIDWASRYDRGGSHVTLNDVPDYIQEKFINLIDSPEIKELPRDYSDDSFWAKIALVGEWSEKKSSDKALLATLLETDYPDIRRKLQEDSLQPNPNVSFMDGIWHINHRRSVIKSCSKTFFDDIIKKAFEVSKAVLKEKDKRIKENGDYDWLTPEGGAFDHSDALRNGLIHGLAIICNIGIQTSCSSGLISSEARDLIRTVFSDSDKTVWMSLDSYLPVIAEICPETFLDCLERQIVTSPESIEALFPKANDNYIFSRNFISSVLWAVEGLAWDENYLIKCIRILGLLANLKYEKTNYSNTPTNSIISIMLPWHIQTMASVDKQKSALMALQRECPAIAWQITTQLLPHATRMTGGTHRPRYILPNLPKEIKLSNQDVASLYQYYSQLALTLARESYEKMQDLLSDFDHMGRETIIEFLSLVNVKAANWDDSQKYPFWKTFCIEKQWLTHRSEDEIDSSMVEILDSSIVLTAPSDIRYSHRLLYESGYIDYDDDDQFETKWQAQRNKQENAVYEIFTVYGIDSVVEFGMALNQPAWIAQHLGMKLNEEEFCRLVQLCYENKIEKTFFATVIYGYIIVKGPEALSLVKFDTYDVNYVVWVLSRPRLSTRLFEIAEQVLQENIDLFWRAILIPRFGLDNDIELDIVWKNLVKVERYAAAVNLFGISVENCKITHTEICTVLIKAATTESDDELDPDAVINLIDLLQREQNISIEDISNIEMIYLPWLDRNSRIKPLALQYRLANEPEFFCEMIKLFYKKRHSDEHEKPLSEPAVKRLYHLIYDFRVVPGTDWSGEYHEDIFTNWIAYCKKWGKEEDRETVVLQTIGRGLSYAKKLDNGLIDEFIMNELNKVENDEMRTGYYMGIFNQRGVVTVDPEGKPELQLAQKYNDMAENVEIMGYAKYAEVLRNLARDYTNEAMHNIKEHRHTQEIQRREEDDS